MGLPWGHSDWDSHGTLQGAQGSIPGPGFPLVTHATAKDFTYIFLGVLLP